MDDVVLLFISYYCSVWDSIYLYKCILKPNLKTINTINAAYLMILCLIFPHRAKPDHSTTKFLSKTNQILHIEIFPCVQKEYLQWYDSHLS